MRSGSLPLSLSFTFKSSLISSTRYPRVRCPRQGEQGRRSPTPGGWGGARGGGGEEKGAGEEGEGQGKEGDEGEGEEGQEGAAAEGTGASDCTAGATRAVDGE